MTKIDEYLKHASLAELFELQRKLGKAIQKKLPK